jgi:iron complex transport system substrate-binding protein
MRIVSLISSATEILFALGLGDQVVAVSHECDYPAPAARLPRTTRSGIDSSLPSSQIDDQVKAHLAAGNPLYAVDAELLCRLAPDLIVTQAQCDVCAVRYTDVVALAESRRELRGTKILALNPQTLDDVLADVQRVGNATQTADGANSLVNGLRRRINRVADHTAQLHADKRLRVVCIEWVLPLMAAGNWTPELIELAGGRSGLAAARQHSDYVSWEQVRQFDAEVLLIAPCGFDLERSLTESLHLWELPGFADLAAMRNGRTFVLNGNAYLNRSGPRLVESLELLAYLLHPDHFPAPSGELAEGRAWARLPPLHA